MVFSGKIKESDALATYFLHISRSTRNAERLCWLLAGFMIFEFARAYFIYYSSVVLIGLFIIYILIPFLVRRKYRELKTFNEPKLFELKDEGIYCQDQYGASLIPWTYIKKWRWNKKVILIYTTKTDFYFIPVHLFNNNQDFENFKAALNENLGAAKLK